MTRPASTKYAADLSVRLRMPANADTGLSAFGSRSGVGGATEDGVVQEASSTTVNATL
jgi:hypothetical protein